MLCVCSADGNKREARDVSDIQVGMEVVMKERQPVLHGIVQFVGQTSFASGMWVGIKLEVPLGKNNGIVQGVKYFQCLPLHGLFVRPQQLAIVVPSIVEPVQSNESPIPGAVSTIKQSVAEPPSARRSINNKLGNSKTHAASTYYHQPNYQPSTWFCVCSYHLCLPPSTPCPLSTRAHHFTRHLSLLLLL